EAGISGATPLPGLYAAGECANVGLNGANRLGSNSLPECLVFGAAAGRAAARYAQSTKAPTANPIAGLVRDEERRVAQTYAEPPPGYDRGGGIREDLQKAMDQDLGVFPARPGLE